MLAEFGDRYFWFDLFCFFVFDHQVTKLRVNFKIFEEVIVVSWLFDFFPLKGLVDSSDFSFFGEDIGFDPNDKLVALFLFKFSFNSLEEFFIGFDMS